MRKFYYLSFGLIILGGVLSLAYYFYSRYYEMGTWRKYRVALIENHNTFVPNFKGFRQGMRELGYEEGKNLEYITFSPAAQGESFKISNAASQVEFWKKHEAEFLAAKPDVIVVASGAVTQYLSQRGLTIPVVYMGLDLPGAVKNPLKPEGNLTGIIGGLTEFAGKRLEMLKAISPSIKKVIVSPELAFPQYAPFMQVLRPAAVQLGLEIVEIPSANTADFLKRLDEIISRKNGDAFMFFPGPNTTPSDLESRKRIVAQLIKEKMPAITHNMELGANEGILASYGASRFDTGVDAAFMVYNILQNKPVSSLPVAPPSKGLRLELNLKTAKAVGIEIGPDLLLRADRIYNE